MAALLPAMLLSSLAVGASEELLFRLCLPSLFRNAGLPGQGAGLVSMLLFTLGHTGQGRIGVLASIFFGAVLQRSADRGEGYPTLALGHAFYDFSILCLMFAV
jgi:membrane protease YdiL (CAAX protease family)